MQKLCHQQTDFWCSARFQTDVSHYHSDRYFYGTGVWVSGRIPLCTDFEYFLWTGAMDSISDADLGNYRISVRTSGVAKSAAQPHTADDLGHADGNAVFRHYGYLDGAGSDRCVVLETVSDGTEHSCTVYYCLYVIQCSLFNDWIKTIGGEAESCADEAWNILIGSRIPSLDGMRLLFL